MWADRGNGRPCMPRAGSAATHTTMTANIASIWSSFLPSQSRLRQKQQEKGGGPRYLIHPAAWRGKTNSIVRLAQRLIVLTRGGNTLCDTVVVVTDRRILDRQIQDTSRRFAQAGLIVGYAQDSGHLHSFLQKGKRLVISTGQTFPFVLDAIGNEHKGGKFAIVIGALC